LFIHTFIHSFKYKRLEYTSSTFLKGFEGTDEMTFFQKRVGCTRGHDLKLFEKRVKLDVGKFSFKNRVCDD